MATALALGSCFIDTEPDDRPTPAPYRLELSARTPMLEPLQLFFSSQAGLRSREVEACLEESRNRRPVFAGSFRVAPPPKEKQESGDSCESGPRDAPLAIFSWPDAGPVGAVLQNSYWQIQKFRPFSASLLVHGNEGRIAGISVALDDDPPAAEFHFSNLETVQTDSTPSPIIQITLLRIQPIRAPTEGYDFPWYDFEAELRIDIDSSRLTEGPHRLAITVDSPEITMVQRETWENGRKVGEETEATTRFTYQSCFDVLLNATAIKRASDGALWVGTFENGLMKVDLGKSRDSRDDDSIAFFEGDSIDSGPLGLPALTGDLPGNSIARLAIDPQGNLWVGTLFHDFGIMREGMFSTKYDTPDIEEFEFTMDMLLGDSTRLVRYLDQELSDTVTAFAFPSDREAMIGTLNGLFYLNHKGTLTDTSDDDWVRLGPDDGLGDENIIGVEADKTGLIWIATTDLSDVDQPGEVDGEGIYVLDMNGTPAKKSDDRWVNFTPEEGGFDERLLVFKIDPEGGKWIGGIGGLSYLDDGGTPSDKSDDQWARFGVADGFIDEDISDIYFYGMGRYLIGTVDILEAEPNTPPGGALIYLRLDGNPAEKKIKALVNYTIDDGFLDADVSAIDLDRFGRVVFSSFNFFHSPIVTFLYSIAEPTQESGSANVFSLLSSTPAANGLEVFGRDGLSFVDFGEEETARSDDQIANLIPRRGRLKGRRF